MIPDFTKPTLPATSLRPKATAKPTIRIPTPQPLEWGSPFDDRSASAIQLGFPKGTKKKLITYELPAESEFDEIVGEVEVVDEEPTGKVCGGRVARLHQC